MLLPTGDAAYAENYVKQDAIVTATASETNFSRSDLSQAVVQYLGYSLELSPIRDEAKLFQIYGKVKGADLLDEVQTLADEANQISIDWNNTSLDVAGQTVREEMHRRYPYLEGHALDAIAWKFTFDWR